VAKNVKLPNPAPNRTPPIVPMKRDPSSRCTDCNADAWFGYVAQHHPEFIKPNERLCYRCFMLRRWKVPPRKATG
jgi:hypothetical protein